MTRVQQGNSVRSWSAAAEEYKRQGGGNGQAQRPVPGGLRLVLQLIGQPHESGRQRQHVPAERGEGGGARGTFEQRLTEVPFQRGDAAARDGLGDPGRRRADGETAALADVDERPACPHKIHGPALCQSGMEPRVRDLDGGRPPDGRWFPLVHRQLGGSIP